MKNIKHLSKRALALLLALVMCLSLVQLTAFADEGEGNTEVTEGNTEVTDAIIDGGNGDANIDGGNGGNGDANTDGDNGGDGGTDGGSNDGTDAGSNDGTDAGSNDGTDAGSNDGTDGGSNDGTDAGSNDGTDAGSNDGTDAGNNDTTEEPPVVEIPAEVKAFLDAVAAIPKEITPENAEEVAEYVYGPVSEAYEALLGTEYEERADVLEAVAVYGQAVADVDAALEIANSTFEVVTKTDNVTKTAYSQFNPNTSTSNTVSNGFAENGYGTVVLTDENPTATDVAFCHYWGAHIAGWPNGFQMIAVERNTKPGVATATARTSENGLIVEFEKGNQAGETTICIGFTITTLRTTANIASSDQTYAGFSGYLYYTVTNGDGTADQNKPTSKPVVNSATMVHFKCISYPNATPGTYNNTHALSGSLANLEAYYTLGDIVPNDGTDSRAPADTNPWMCVLTLKNNACLSLYNQYKSSRLNNKTHYLAYPDQEVTLRYYYDEEGWYSFRADSPLVIWMSETNETTYKIVREYYIDGTKVAGVDVPNQSGIVGQTITGGPLDRNNSDWKYYTIDGDKLEFGYTTFTPTPSLKLSSNTANNVITLRYERASYKLEKLDKYGTVLCTKTYDSVPAGHTVSATDADKTYTTDYKFDANASNVLEAKVKADGTTTLKLYFFKKVNVTWMDGYNNTPLHTITVFEDEIPEGDYYQTPAPDGLGKTPPTKPADNDYTYEFEKWSDPETDGDGNVTYKAVYKEQAKPTKYTVTVNYVTDDETTLGSITYELGNGVSYNHSKGDGTTVPTNGGADVKSPKSIIKDGKTYVFDEVATTDALTGDMGDEDIVINVVYSLDDKGTIGTDDEGNPTDTPDGIPDKYQAKVVYNATEGGTQNGTNTYATIMKDGKMATEGTISIAGATATPDSTHYFVNWTAGATGHTGWTYAASTDAALAGFSINDAKGGAVYTFTANFAAKAELKIEIVGNTKTVNYNGSEQSVTGYTMTVKDKDGNVIALPADGLTVTPASDSCVAKGTNAQNEKYPMGLTEDGKFSVTGDDTGKYTVTFSVTDGWLTIIPRETALSVSAGDVGTTYDGQGHPVTPVVTFDGQTVADLGANGITVTVVYKDKNGNVIDGLPTDAGEYTATITAKKAGEKDATATATVTIAKKTLTVTTDSASKTYTGTALTAPGRIEGLVDGETVTFTVTGSQTEVDSSSNTYTLTWDGSAKESNYTIESVTIGTLTVNSVGGNESGNTNSGGDNESGNDPEPDEPTVNLPEEDPPLVDLPEEPTPEEPAPEEPVVELPDEQPPLVDLPDEQPPLVDLPDEQPPLTVWPIDPEWTFVPDEQPPLVELPEEQPPLVDIPAVEVPEETVPLADAPQTGDISLAWHVVAALSACGLAVLSLKKRDDEE